MKNHIIQSIIETASLPINRSGIAAINQLIIEVASEFPGVIPTGFSFMEVSKPGQELHHRYHLHAELEDPWPLEEKAFCGGGNTIQDAMKSLRKELAAYFVPVESGIVLRGKEVMDLAGNPIPDRRTEFAA